MKPPRNRTARILSAVFIALMIFIGCSYPSLASEMSKNSKMGGLYDNEIISIDDLRQKQMNYEKFLLIDARNKQSYDEGHIPGAMLSLTKEHYRQAELFRMGIIQSLPDGDIALSQVMSKYPKNTAIVTYCNDHCQASAVLLLKIKRLGFENVRALADGIQTWQSRGYPVVKSDKTA